MKILFVSAMESEAIHIINKYNLHKVDTNYFKKDNIELIITGVSRNGITKSLVNFIYDYKVNLNEYIMINFGLVGSNKLEVGTIVIVKNSYAYHMDTTMFGDKLYHGINSPCKLNTIDTLYEVDCYTSDGFVLNTNIEKPVIFDMELNALTCFPHKKLYSIKVVSDCLNSDNYRNFKIENKLDEIFIAIDNIIWSEK